MAYNKDEIFDDYTNALETFKKTYLYEGHKEKLKDYAFSIAEGGVEEDVRDDSYSNCIQYDDSGKATWKIVSPKNIFGVEMIHSVDRKEDTKITSRIALNSGRYNLNRIMVKFASIDVTDMSDEQISSIVQSILEMNNEEVISKFNIKENPNGILTNAIILDVVLDYLKKQNKEKYPEIDCNAITGEIALKRDGDNIIINNNSITYNEDCLNYNITRKFPNGKFIIDGIKGDRDLFNMISDKFTSLNDRKKEEEIINSILAEALKKQEYENRRDSAKDLYAEYLQSNLGRNKNRDEL